MFISPVGYQGVMLRREATSHHNRSSARRGAAGRARPHVFYCTNHAAGLSIFLYHRDSK